MSVGKVAVVLSGAGARGAFQAGALAALLPALEREGSVPSIWLGTSAGSISAALWCAQAHRGVAEATAHVEQVWRRMDHADVYRPLVPFSVARTAIPYAAGAILGAGDGTVSLLDTTPLHRTAEKELNPTELERNVADGTVEAVGVVATRMPRQQDAASEGTASGRSVLFLHQHAPGGYSGDESRALDVVEGPIRREHVLASAAIPVAFPPQRVQAPPEATGWYVDGGVRLNTPLHPAVGLGADRILVVSATATRYEPLSPDPRPGRSPDVADASAQVLNAVLSDRTVEDLRTLRRTNRWVAAVDDPAALRREDGAAYRRIEVMVVSPPAGEMGRTAARVYRERARGASGLRHIDNLLLGRALRGAGDGVGWRELLSYVLFDRDYFAACIDLGEQAAEEALRRGWSYG